MPRMTTGIGRTGAGACALRAGMDGTQASGIAAAAATRRHTIIGGWISEYQRAA
jgi:hypothetical protein